MVLQAICFKSWNWVLLIVEIAIHCAANQMFYCIFLLLFFCLFFCCHMFLSFVFYRNWPINLQVLNEGLSLSKHRGLFKHQVKRKRRVFVINFERNFEIFVGNLIACSYFLCASTCLCYCAYFIYVFIYFCLRVSMFLKREGVVIVFFDVDRNLSLTS